MSRRIRRITGRGRDMIDIDMGGRDGAKTVSLNPF
jgi:hypothetical protein